MSKYSRTIKGVTMDVYDVLRAFEVTSPAIQHAVKKLLMPGARGNKDQLQDVQEALQSIQREIEYLTSIEPAESKEAGPNGDGWIKNNGEIPINCDIVDIVLFTAKSGEVDTVECTDADIWGWSLNQNCEIVLYRPAKL